ncbi:MAG: hypothetical protein M0P66_12680 [Salinivirgaceae bacterium]|nr:hypothetical protein [Salinivirgaceae bacterium]
MIKKYNLSWILLSIAFVIFLIPIIAKIPAFYEIFDFTKSGQIGDTIGGITSPFINGLAAILVYIAFVEQKKANELFRNQELQKTAIEEFNRFQDKKNEHLKAISFIQLNGLEYVSVNEKPRLNNVVSLLLELFQLLEFIESNKIKSKYLLNRIITHYEIIYKDHLNELQKENIKYIESLKGDEPNTNDVYRLDFLLHELEIKIERAEPDELMNAIEDYMKKNK